MVYEQYELVELTNRGHRKIARGSWDSIMKKMEGAGHGLFDGENRRKITRKLFDMSMVVFSTVLVYNIYQLIVCFIGG